MEITISVKMLLIAIGVIITVGCYIWSTTPKLKACFKDEKHALEVFEKELIANLPELQKHGLFFSFTTDPFLPETKKLTINAAIKAVTLNVPVKFLTKVAIDENDFFGADTRFVAFGFTLTGHDKLEPNASTNAERIEAMRKLHKAGFKTWASIEPVIDFESSLQMIKDSFKYCDLYKIGLESGKKYDTEQLQIFVVKVLSFASELKNNDEYIARKMLNLNPHKAYDFLGKFYFKDSLLAQAGINREYLPANCVGRDYNMFND